MRYSKQIIFITAPILIFIVLFVLYIKANIFDKEHNLNSIDMYPDTVIAPKSDYRRNKDLQFKSDEPKESPPLSSEYDLFNDWQQSDNIKQVSDTFAENTSVGNEIGKPPKKVDEQQLVRINNIKTVETNPGIDNDLYEEDFWAWIPQININKKEKTMQKTDSEREKLRNFINEYGEKVKKNVRKMNNQPEIMKEFMQNRGKPGNKDRVNELANKYKELSVELEEFVQSESIPANFRDMGLRLSKSYGNVGAAHKMLADRETTSDADMLKVLYEYNSEIDKFAKDFIAFANLVGAYGFMFGQHEGGGIFTPPVALVPME